MPHTARCDVPRSPLMCHSEVMLCVHIALSRVLAMLLIAIDRVSPIASTQDRESGASESTFERFRRLCVGPRLGARLRGLSTS